MENAPVKVEIDKPMSRRELDRREELEEILNEDLISFFRVGLALKEISETKLYRATHKTFESYVKDQFEMSRRRAYQLIDSSQIVEFVNNCTQKAVAPVCESQVRPLVKFKDDPEKVGELWSMAVATSKKQKPTARQVNKVVKEYLGEEFKEKITRASTAVRDSKLIDKSIKGLFQQLLQEIYDIKKSGYKTTSRLAICNHLDAARSLISGDGDNIEEKKIERSNREKLMRAGYAFIRADRAKNAIMIEDRTATGWQVLATASAENIDYHLAELLKENDKYLAD